MRRSLMARVGYIVCVCLCIVASACLFVLRDELRWERETLNRSYTMLMDHEVARADAQITMLDTGLLGRLRTWRGWKNPYERLLRGTIKIEQGEYAQAIRYLQESQDACIKGGFNGSICHALNAEILFRQANASILSRQRRSINAAIAYYERGLRLQPDDAYAKKSLDWLKVFEEHTQDAREKDKEKGKGISRERSDMLEKESNPGDGEGAMRKGY